jgi:hypothetical protein
MTTTALIEAPEQLHEPGGPLAGLPPLLGLVPQAGPPIFVYAGFGAALLLLLVPPFALLATLIGVALVMATALAMIAAVAGAIVAAPMLLVRRLRHRGLRQYSLPIPRFDPVRVRRI